MENPSSKAPETKQAQKGLRAVINKIRDRLTGRPQIDLLQKLEHGPLKESQLLAALYEGDLARMEELRLNLRRITQLGLVTATDDEGGTRYENSEMGMTFLLQHDGREAIKRFPKRAKRILEEYVLDMVETEFLDLFARQKKSGRDALLAKWPVRDVRSAYELDSMLALFESLGIIQEDQDFQWSFTPRGQWLYTLIK